MPIFKPNESISSVRLRLSVLDSAVIDSLPWLDAALAPDWMLGDLRQALQYHPGVLISEPDGNPVGLAVVHLNTPEPGAVSIPFLAIDPARRFRGLGGEAGLAIERQLRTRLGTTRFYAPIPDGRGLAVYFWLRLGYRPLVMSESPGALVGLTAQSPAGIWMLRDTA